MTSEHDHQAALVQWLGLKHIGCFSVPNGSILGGRNKWGLLEKLRKEGLRTGAPDLVLINLAADGRPICIEMKRPGGKVSPEQLEVHAEMEAAGWHVLVGYGFDDARAKVEDAFGRRPRARPGHRRT